LESNFEEGLVPEVYTEPLQLLSPTVRERERGVFVVCGDF
jgi:hypothetical protein